MTIHIRKRQDARFVQTRGQGATWCGKKLLGNPIDPTETGIETFSSYGSQVHVTTDPAAAGCEHCIRAFNTAYEAAFPEGLKPIATFKLDDPMLGEKLGAIIRKHAPPPAGCQCGCNDDPFICIESDGTER